MQAMKGVVLGNGMKIQRGPAHHILFGPKLLLYILMEGL